MTLLFAITNTVSFHLPHYFIFMFNIPEENRTYATLVSSTMLIYYKVNISLELKKPCCIYGESLSLTNFLGSKRTFSSTFTENETE